MQVCNQTWIFYSILIGHGGGGGGEGKIGKCTPPPVRKCFFSAELGLLLADDLFFACQLKIIVPPTKHSLYTPLILLCNLNNIQNIVITTITVFSSFYWKFNCRALAHYKITLTLCRLQNGSFWILKKEKKNHHNCERKQNLTALISSSFKLKKRCLMKWRAKWNEEIEIVTFSFFIKSEGRWRFV